MRISIVPFDPAKHLEASALLLAERQVRDRVRDPRLPAAYEVPAACRPLIEQAVSAERTCAVAAVSDGEVVGFAAGTAFLATPTHMTAAFFPPRCINIGYAAHAAAAGAEYDVYRELYAAIADHFVTRGYFDHNVYLPAGDAAAADAWVSLGFGRTVTAGLRGVEPVAGRQASIELHAAASEDAAVVFALNDELTDHHAKAPIFWPHVVETDDSTHDFQRDLLKDPKTNAHWVAYDGEQALGMNTFMAPFWMPQMATPDKTIYLYQGIVSERARAGGVGKAILAKALDWAREQGYRYVGLHYASPNISGARFWREHGFDAVEHRMTRHVDERIAWAHA